MSQVFFKIVKGSILYLVLLLIVTAAASVMSCLFLPNGNVDYLFDFEKLIWFIWSVRAGLKVTIIFITTIVFLLLVEDGFLCRQKAPAKKPRRSKFKHRL